MIDPKRALLNEPNSALDPELVGEELLDVMRDLAEGGTTVIVVTHEMGFAREVGGQFPGFIDRGVVVESGTPLDVLSNPHQQRTDAFLSKVL